MTITAHLCQYAPMCTLLLFTRLWPDTPLVVAANRDEFLDRPASPPVVRNDGPYPVLAPIDTRAGGTWLGINSQGLFVGITNRFGAPNDPSRRSRGLLVLDALGAPNAQEAALAIADQSPTDHNGFHLVLADRQSAWCVCNDGATLCREELVPGVHAFTERSLGAAHDARRSHLMEKASGWVDNPNAVANATLQAALQVHDPSILPGTCLHASAMGYGTRSSTIVRLGAGGRAAEVLHADGPPCTTSYEDYSALAETILVA
jgi:uncharacterized protein with NRDE domain